MILGLPIGLGIPFSGSSPWDIGSFGKRFTSFSTGIRWKYTSDEYHISQDSFMFKDYNEEGELISTRLYENHFPTEWAEKMELDNFLTKIISLEDLEEYSSEELLTVDMDALMEYSQNLHRDSISAKYDHCMIIEDGETYYENILAMNKSFSSVPFVFIPNMENMEVVSIKPPMGVFWTNLKGWTWNGMSGAYYYLPDEDGTYETALITNGGGKVIGTAFDYDYDGYIKPNNYKWVISSTLFQTYHTIWDSGPLTIGPLSWLGIPGYIADIGISLGINAEFNKRLADEYGRPNDLWDVFEYELVPALGDAVFDLWKMAPYGMPYTQSNEIWDAICEDSLRSYIDYTYWESVLYWDAYLNQDEILVESMGDQFQKDLVYETFFGITSVIVSTIVSVAATPAAGALAGMAVYTLEHILFGLDKQEEAENTIKAKTFQTAGYIGTISLSRKIEGDEYSWWEQILQQAPKSWHDSPALKTVYAPVSTMTDRFTYEGYIVIPDALAHTTATRDYNFYTGIIDVGDSELVSKTIALLMLLSDIVQPFMDSYDSAGWGDIWDFEPEDTQHNPFYGEFISQMPLLNTLLNYPTNNIPYMEGAVKQASRMDDSITHPLDRIIPVYIGGVPGFTFASSEGPMALPDFYEEYPLLGGSTYEDPNNVMYKFFAGGESFTDAQFDKLRTFEVIPRNAPHSLKSNITSIDLLSFSPYFVSDWEALVIPILTLAPDQFSYDPATRKVTIDEDIFDVIKSRIKGNWEFPPLFAYKINIETSRAITDPNDDLSDAQAAKAALMQAIQFNILAYNKEYMLGSAQAAVDFETVYTLKITAISTSITIAASVAAGAIAGVSSVAGSVLDDTSQQFMEQVAWGLSDDVASSAASRVISSTSELIAVSIAEGSLAVAQAGISVVKECFEELFTDRIVEGITTDIVARLGGDEKAQVFWSTIAESFREGISGPISDTIGIKAMTNFIVNRFTTFMDKRAKLKAQQAYNEYHTELWEARVMNTELESTIANCELSRFLFTASSLSAEPTIDTARYSSGDVLHMTDTLIYENMIGAVSTRDMLTAVREAEIHAADTMFIATDSNLAMEQEVAHPELMAFKTELDRIAQSCMARVKKQSSQFLSEQQIRDIYEQGMQLMTPEGPRPICFMTKTNDIDDFLSPQQMNDKMGNTQSETDEKTIEIYDYRNDKVRHMYDITYNKNGIIVIKSKDSDDTIAVSLKHSKLRQSARRVRKIFDFQEQKLIASNAIDKRVHKIYKVTFLTDKGKIKVYIGQTIQTIEERFKQELTAAYTKGSTEYNYPYSRALRKYLGKDLTIDQALERSKQLGIYPQLWQVCADQNDVDNAERFWIGYFHAQYHEYGYNILKGGQGVPREPRIIPFEFLEEAFEEGLFIEGKSLVKENVLIYLNKYKKDYGIDYSITEHILDNSIRAYYGDSYTFSQIKQEQISETLALYLKWGYKPSEIKSELKIAENEDTISNWIREMVLNGEIEIETVILSRALRENLLEGNFDGRSIPKNLPGVPINFKREWLIELKEKLNNLQLRDLIRSVLTGIIRENAHNSESEIRAMILEKAHFMDQALLTYEDIENLLDSMDINLIRTKYLNS
jgi:hypothetical protein